MEAKRKTNIESTPWSNSDTVTQCFNAGFRSFSLPWTAAYNPDPASLCSKEIMRQGFKNQWKLCTPTCSWKLPQGHLSVFLGVWIYLRDCSYSSFSSQITCLTETFCFHIVGVILIATRQSLPPIALLVYVRLQQVHGFALAPDAPWGQTYLPHSPVPPYLQSFTCHTFNVIVNIL